MRYLPRNIRENGSKDGGLREAIKEIEPSALREIYVEVPTASWDDVGG